jgi:hypothetical protein
MISTATRLESLAQGLQAYQFAHGTLPPDLTTLSDSGQLSPVSLPWASGPVDPIADVYYVPDVQSSDPGHWIVAYADTAIMGHKLVVVVYANGTTTPIEAAQFQRELATFQQEYQAARGKPPVILAPQQPEG